MLPKLQQWLFPESEDPVLRRRWHTLTAILGSTFLLNTVLSVVISLNAPKPAPALEFTGLIFLIILLAYLLLRMGKFELAASLFFYSFAALLLFGAYQYPSTQEMIFTAYLVLFLTAGVTLGMRLSLPIGGIGLLAGLLITTGLLLPDSTQPELVFPPEVVWSVYIALLIWASIFLYVALTSHQFAITLVEKESARKKDALDAMHRLDSFYQDIVSKLSEGIVLLDESGVITFANPAAAALLAFAPGELIGLHWTQIIPEDKYSFVQQVDERRMQGESDRYELDLIDKNGRRFPVLVSGSPRFDSQTNQFTGTVAVFTDLSDIKQIVQALEASEDLLESYFNQANDIIFTIDQNGQATFVNIAASEFIGLPKSQLLGQSPLAFLPEENQPAASQLIQAVLSGEEIEAYETQVITHSGEYRWLEVRGRAVLRSGQAAGVLFIARDISERKQSEAEIARLAAVVEQAAESVVITDSQGRMIYVNPHFTQTSGYSRADALGKNAGILASGELQPQFFKQLWDTILAGNSWSGTLANRRKDGSIFYEEAVIFPIKEASGKPLNFAAVKRDITDQVLAQRALQEYAHRLEVLNSMQLAIIEASNAHNIAHTAFHFLHGLSDFDLGAVMLFEPGLQEVSLLAYENQNQTTQGEEGRRLSLFPQDVARLTLDDVTYFPEFTEIPDPTPLERTALAAYPLKSLAYFPLKQKTEPVGILLLGSYQAHAFADTQIEAAKDVAIALSIAIQQVNLIETERRLRYEAETIQQLTASMTETLDLNLLLNQMLDNLNRVVPFDTGSVMLLNGSTLNFAARQGAYPAARTSIILDQENMPHVHQVLQGRQAVIIPDVHTDPNWQILKGEEYIHCWMGVPLVYKDRTLGLLNLNKSESSYYTPESAKLALAFANQASAAIENARLFEAERRRSSELEVLHQASLRLTSSLERKKVLEAILENTIALTSAENAHIFLYDGKKLSFGAAYWAGAVQPRPIVEPRPTGISNSAVQSGQPVIVPDCSKNPLTWEFPSLGAIIGMPLKVGAQVLGVMNIAYPEVHDFSEDELRILDLLGDQAAIALENARLFAETQRRLHHMDSLRTIDQAITASVDLNLTLTILLEQVTSQLAIDAANVLLLSQHTQLLELAARRGFRTGALRPMFLRLGESHAGRAALERRTIEIPDLLQTSEDIRQAAALAQEGFASYYAVPLIAKGQVKGVLEIYNRTPLQPDPEWLEFLESLASEAAIALDNATMFETLQRSNMDLIRAYEETLEGWARALDLRDRETANHTKNVTELSVDLAQFIGMSDRELIHIRRGALLHDIGKMGTPDSILLKPGPLTPEEWEIMKRHPQYAYELLYPIAHLRPAIDIPYCHHERWDGSGYPRGLRGEQIPLSARVFAVVDVWDALNSDRPYRSRWSEDKVRDYLRERAGKDFDPKIVNSFFRMVDSA